MAIHMRRLRKCGVQLLLVCAASLSGDSLSSAQNRQGPANRNPQARLSQGIKSFVEQELIPAYEQQQASTIIQAAQNRLTRATDEQLEEIDALLKQHEAPALAAILTDARMLSLEVAGRRAPKTSVMESVLVVGEVKRRLDEFLEDIRANPLVKDPLPKPTQMVEYRDLLWQAHVDRNRLLVANQLTSVGRLMQRQKNLSRAKNLSDERRDILGTDFRQYDRDLRRLNDELQEGGLELRVKRIDFALKALDQTKSAKQRFLAAYAVGVDGPILLTELKKQKGRFDRPTLSQIDLAELEGKIENGIEKAGDLVAKSELLFAGLHWWRRGRFGSGPVAMGLIKGPAAANNPGERIGLFMPVVSPQPNDPMKNKDAPVPTFDRRHHYSWAYQDREFRDYLAGQESQVSTRNVTRNFEGGHFDGTINGQFW